MAVGPLLVAAAPESLPRQAGLPSPGDIGLRLYASRRMDEHLLERLATAIRQQAEEREPRFH
jgi:hypothetical protein